MLYSALQKFITKEGQPVQGASALVLLSGSSTPATLYGSKTGGAKSNPFLTLSNGEAICYVSPGRYDIIVTKLGDQVTFRDVEVGPVSSVGSFADGCVITDPDQWVFDDDGTMWAYVGALTDLPVTVPAGFVPDANWRVIVPRTSDHILAPDGDTLTEWIESLPDEIDPAGTAAALVAQHNADASAHPALSEFITSEADRAEAAADSAQLTAGIYDDVAAGLAATVSGQYFSVPSTLEDFLTLYKNIAGEAVEINRYPSSGFVVNRTSQAIFLSSRPTDFAGEFHNTDDSAPSYLLTDGEHTVLALDAQGYVVPQPQRKEFYNDDGDLSMAFIEDNGQALLAFDKDGRLALFESDTVRAPHNGTPLLPYVSGDDIHAVGATDVIAANLGDFSALSTHVGNSTAVRAVISRPGISAASSVSVANGVMIPDADNVLHVIIGLGQSLMVGSQAADSLISTEALYPDDVFMFLRDDGLSDVRIGLVTSDSSGAPVLDSADLIGFTPLVAKVGQGDGDRGQTPMESNANTLASAARAIGIRFKTLNFTAAMGNTAYSGLKRGTQPYANMLAAVTKAKALAEAAGLRIIVDGCLHKHGEANQSTNSYYTDLLEWQANIDEDVKAITGQLAPVHFVMHQPSSHTTTTPRAIRFMLDAHNNSPYHQLAGADYAYSEFFAGDFLHFEGQGYYLIGETMARAWQQALWAGAAKSKITQILTANRTGTTVTLTYECPVPPLVFDTTLMSERDVKGFTYVDSAGTVAVSSATITNDGTSGTATVQLVLATTPTGSGEFVRYALSPQSSTRSAANIPRGNVRDSATLESTLDGRPLFNWGVHQQITVGIV